jgi:maltoporin
MFTDHLALQFEGGVDYVDEIRYTPVAGDNGYLTKLTIAPTIRRGRKFWDKPELRLFATYAWWSSSGRGLVGLPAYAEVTEGWNFGVQAETWW